MTTRCRRWSHRFCEKRDMMRFTCGILASRAAEDERIFSTAGADNRVIVSADTDFGTLLAMRQETKPSVILFRRIRQRRAHGQVRLLLVNLPEFKESLEQGAIVVIEESRIRITLLPISREHSA